MKKFISLSIVLIALLCSQIFLPKQNIKTSANSSNKFIIQSYGDSISYGEILADLNDAYPNVFAKHFVDTFDAEFYPNGISGSTSMSLLEKLQPYRNGTAGDMDKFNDTDLVVLCIGANNVLIPGTSSIPSYLSGQMDESEFRQLLSSNVEQFKLDYPRILETFENKKVIAMTVYNPYKYTTLNDMAIDPSITQSVASVKSLLNLYNMTLQEMLSICMEYLQVINAEITKYQSENVQVIDIWTLFSKFSKQEYLEYINADLSKATVTETDIQNLSQNNFDSLLTKIYDNCDPHPSKAGHNVIAQKHLEEYNIFEISKKENTNSQTTTISIKSILNKDYVYKFFKQTSSGKVLLKETNQTSIEIENSKITDAEKIYAEVYNNNTKVDTTNYINIEKPNNNNSSWLVYVIVSVSIILVGSIVTVVLLKRKKSK